MKGDLVVVQSAEGPLLRQVVEADENVVFIASPDQYQRRVEGLSALDPVGFPRSYVYVYDPEAKGILDGGDFDWTAARPY